jgi:hypothetical protein
MKTNVKNGIIFLGEVATDSDTIRIGDIKPSRLVTGGRFLRLETLAISFFLRFQTKESPLVCIV